MTLGMLGIARSLAFLYTGGEPIPVVDMRFLKLGIGYLWESRSRASSSSCILIVAALVLRYTPFGRVRLRHRQQRGGGPAQRDRRAPG